jgi:hypothetical protein
MQFSWPRQEEFQKVQEIEAEERLEEAEPANVTPANIRQAELVGYIGVLLEDTFSSFVHTVIICRDLVM